MKALSRSLSIDIVQYAELVLLLTQLFYLFITSLINPFYCYMLFSVCLYKPQINIITVCMYVCMYIYIYIYVCMCVCIYIYIYISSSSCRAISTDIPDPLLPPLSIIHCFQLVLRAASRVGRELLYIGLSCWSCLCMSM